MGIYSGNIISALTTQTLSPANETVGAGYYEGTTLSAVDADLAAANIKKNVVLFGVTGTYDNSASPITAATVATGLEGFVNGAKVTGTGTKTLSVANDTVAAGYYAATTLSAVDTDLATANIKSGVTIFGIAGKTEVVDTTSGTAIAAEILATKVAWVDGIEITGSMANNAGDVEAVSAHAGATTHIHVIPATGYVDGSDDATVIDLLDVPTEGAKLITGNIKAGVTLFGVAGKASVVETADGTVKAIGTITTSGDGAEAGNTVLIDAKTYTFVTPIGVTEGNVLVDGTPAERLDNLKNAINKGDGGGTLYVCVAAHPTVEATTNTDLVQTLQALTAGNGGNVTLTVTADHLAASDATLTGGLSAAAAPHILAGYFAWVNGVKIEGSHA